MMQITLGYPSFEEEINILDRFSEDEPMEALQLLLPRDVIWRRDGTQNLASDDQTAYFSSCAKTRSIATSSWVFRHVQH